MSPAVFVPKPLPHPLTPWHTHSAEQIADAYRLPLPWTREMMTACCAAGTSIRSNS